MGARKGALQSPCRVRKGVLCLGSPFGADFCGVIPLRWRSERRLGSETLDLAETACYSRGDFRVARSAHVVVKESPCRCFQIAAGFPWVKWGGAF